MSQDESDMRTNRLDCGCLEIITAYPDGDFLVRTDFCEAHAKAKSEV